MKQMIRGIKTWGCVRTSENSKFTTNKEGNPVVRVTREIECRYSNLVPESTDPEQEQPEGMALEIAEPDSDETSTTEPELTMAELREHFRRFLA